MPIELSRDNCSLQVSITNTHCPQLLGLRYRTRMDLLKDHDLPVADLVAAGIAALKRGENTIEALVAAAELYARRRYRLA